MEMHPLSFEVRGFKVHASIGGESPGWGTPSVLDFYLIPGLPGTRQAYIGTLTSTGPYGFPDSWDFTGTTVVDRTVLAMPELTGIITGFPQARALLEAAAVYKLRRLDLVP